MATIFPSTSFAILLISLAIFSLSSLILSSCLLASSRSRAILSSSSALPSHPLSFCTNSSTGYASLITVFSAVTTALGFE